MISICYRKFAIRAYCIFFSWYFNPWFMLWLWLLLCVMQYKVPKEGTNIRVFLDYCWSVQTMQGSPGRCVWIVVAVSDYAKFPQKVRPVWQRSVSRKHRYASLETSNGSSMEKTKVQGKGRAKWKKKRKN